MKAVMASDFWSTEDLRDKYILNLVTKMMKFGVIVLVIYALVVSGIQFILNEYPRWPFIPEEVYTYYKMAFAVMVLGEYVIVYTHTLIFLYHCYHAFCQALLLSMYIERMPENFSKISDNQKWISERYQTAINNALLVGIHQHMRLAR